MNINSFHSVLVLAPHTDDGELGAGGFISKLIENGSSVYYLAFSSADESVLEVYPKDILQTEVIKATAKLGIKKENLLVLKYSVRKLNYHRQDILEELIKIRKKYDFDLILMPSLNDIHQDHKTVAEEGLRAFKEKTILGYELIWNNLSFNTTAFVKLEERHIEAKINSLIEYKSQIHRSYMSREFVKSLAFARGVQIGAPYAECFEIIRMVLN